MNDDDDADADADDADDDDDDDEMFNGLCNRVFSSWLTMQGVPKCLPLILKQCGK